MSKNNPTKIIERYRKEAAVKIVLVDVHRVESRFIDEYTYVHGGLRSLAAYLRQQGQQVELLFNLDPGLDLKGALALFCKNITASQPIIIGFSPHQPVVNDYNQDLRAAADLVRMLNRQGIFPYVILGGHYASFNHLDMLRDLPWLDFIIRGEGEESLSELISELPGRSRLADIAGLTYRSGKKIIANPPRTNLKDIDELPFPVLDHLNYLKQHHLPIASCGITSSRGCYGHCSFCSIQSFYHLSPENCGWRPRSPDKVVEHIAYICRHYGCRHFIFSDDNFIGPGRQGQERAREIAQKIIKRGLNIKFKIFCRTNDIETDTIKLLKQAGLESIGLGIESASDMMLKLYRKGTTVNLNKKVLLLLNSLRIKFVPGLIFLNPYSTLDEIKKNLRYFKFLDKLKYASIPNDFSLEELVVVSGSPIRRQMEKDGLLKGDYLNGFDYRFKDPRLAKLHKLAHLFNPTSGFLSHLIAGWELKKKTPEQRRWIRSLWQTKKSICFYYALECASKTIKMIEHRKPKARNEFFKGIANQLYRLRMRVNLLDQIHSSMYDA